jgi:hypothetical protein
MIVYDAWTASLLRQLHEDKKVILPKFQRDLTPKSALKSSMRQDAKKHGALPLGMVLWQRPDGIYYAIDGGTREKELLNKTFPAHCKFPVSVYKDMTYEEARDAYTRLNLTGTKQSTGEHIKAYEKNFPTSLRSFLKNPVWGFYENRHKHYEYGCKLFFEAVGLPAYSCQSILDRLTEENDYDDTSVDQRRLDSVLADIARCQSILMQSTTDNNLKPATWWPIMWLYRATQEEPAIRKIVVKSLAERFNMWYGSRTGKIDTSQPNRPKSELDTNMKDLIHYLTGA